MSRTIRRLTKKKGYRDDREPHDRYNKELTPVKRAFNKAIRKQERLALKNGAEILTEFPRRDKSRGARTT